jgi:hypothetical protein
MDPGNTDPLGSLFSGYVKIAPETDRKLELADLVTLGEIWIKIVLTRKDTSFSNTAVGRKTSTYGKVNHLLIENRQRSGKTKTDRTGLQIRSGSKCSGAPTENFGRCLQLNVYFKANYRLEFHSPPQKILLAGIPDNQEE